MVILTLLGIPFLFKSSLFLCYVQSFCPHTADVQLQMLKMTDLFMTSFILFVERYLYF